jgi:hypothetical protein
MTATRKAQKAAKRSGCDWRRRLKRSGSPRADNTISRANSPPASPHASATTRPGTSSDHDSDCTCSRPK